MGLRPLRYASRLVGPGSYGVLDASLALPPEALSDMQLASRWAANAVGSEPQALTR